VHLNLYQGVYGSDLGGGHAPNLQQRFSKPVPAVIENKQIDIRDILPDPNILKKKDTYFINSCNIRSQLIYCEIASADVTTAHLIVYFDGSKRLLKTILSRLSHLQYNIVRSQVREGILGEKTAILPRFIEAAERPFTANLYVEIHNAAAGVNIGYLKSEIFAEFVEHGWMDIVQYHPMVPPLIAEDH
jgi:hypothetical protein